MRADGRFGLGLHSWGPASPVWTRSLPRAPQHTHTQILHPPHSAPGGGPTFDALLEPLAAPFVGTPPRAILGSLILHVLTVFALGRGRGWETAGLTQDLTRPTSDRRPPAPAPQARLEKGPHALSTI